MEPATATVQHEDDRVRVTLWHFPPGTETGWHVHPHDYVVVPVEGGMLTVEDRTGRRDYPIATGQSYARPEGVDHNIVNATDSPIAFVEIELKERHAPATKVD